MVSTVIPRGIYHGDEAWWEETDFRWFQQNIFESADWTFSNSHGTSSVELRKKVTERVSIPPTDTRPQGTASAVYFANLRSGRSGKSVEVVVKVFMRIPYIPLKKGKQYVSIKDLYSQQLPVSEEYADESSENYDNELNVLRYLTDKKCSYSPALITTFEDIKRNPWVKHGHIGFIVMEMLQATVVSKIWDSLTDTKEGKDEQHRIQEAFKIGYLEIRNLGVLQPDEAARNLMWSSSTNKCYFIDFEQASIASTVREPRTWDSMLDYQTSRYSMFADWGILMKHQEDEYQKDSRDGRLIIERRSGRP